MIMANKVIVNYHDALIYQSDLNLLDEGQWVNDACINFGMTHLAVRHEGNCQDGGSVIRMKFLDPSVVSYFMHQLCLSDEDDIDELCNLYSMWGLSAAKSTPEQMTSGDYQTLVLFIAVNDNNSTGFGSGCNHWSFLLAVIVNGKHFFFHFDSSAGYNQQSAIAVSKRIRDIIMVGSNEQSIDDVDVIECRVPQQVNGYDCGLHTLVTAEVVSEAIDSLAVDEMIGNDVIPFKLSIEEKIGAFIRKFGSTCEMGKEARKRLAANIMFAASNR